MQLPEKMGHTEESSSQTYCTVGRPTYAVDVDSQVLGEVSTNAPDVKKGYRDFESGEGLV